MPNVSSAHVDPLLSTPLLTEHVAQLAALGARRRYVKGVLILQEGDVGDTLFVLLQGRVKVFATDEEGREITYGSYAAGEYFGEMSLDGGPRSASVITLEPCECAVLTQTSLRQYVREHPDFAFELIDRVIARARTATHAMRDMALLDVYGRLVRLLESLALNAQGTLDYPRAITQKLTHQDMASRVGASREMISRLLKDLEHGGFIEMAQRQIVLMKKLPAKW
jgi:CRP/FNR family transcriptional regulator, cyclic AMP receptor protein